MDKRVRIPVFGGFLLIIALVSLYSCYSIPDLLIDVDPVKESISYDEVAKYKIELTNNRQEEMKVSIPTPKSNWGITIKPYILDIPSHASETVQISASPPKQVKFGIYWICFRFKEEGEDLNQKCMDVKVTKSSPVIENRVILFEEISAEELRSKKFLEKTYSVTLINKGNTEANGTWEKEISLFDKFFLSTESSPDFKTVGDKVNIEWSYSIPVGEEVSYSYKVSYLPLLLAGIFLSISGVILAIYYSSRYRVVKRVSKGKKGHITVQISLKNKTGKKQKKVILEDYVPVPLKILHKFGTMSPTAIKNKKDKIILTWKFDELAPHEERMLSYKMKSKLKVEGKVTIPPAVVTQKDKDKKIELCSKVK